MAALFAGAAALAFLAAPTEAGAQQAIVGPEDIVATGFSGTIPGPAPEGADPLDYLAIAPDGPSARVVNVGQLGPQGGLSAAPKPFTVTAAQVGQVFGVALDDAPAPNIYLAATSAYGLSIGIADAGGAVERLRQGEAGAEYLPGLFGPADLGGGPGSIWRVDGTTGQATLFANLGEGLPASLGALAFDGKSQQIFAADRSTGLVHRLGLDGTERGNYDHGIEGRPAAGLPDAPLSPIAVDITSPDFDTEQPASWGFADPERLVFALAVKDERLYYSVAAGPEIWSVGIAPDGSFAADPRLEVASPVLQPGLEIASLAFDGEGRLYAAERAPPTGVYDFGAVATGGDSRVLRFLPKPVEDGTPGLWLPDPESYAIGQAPEFQNANGGVVLGRGYDANGRMDAGRCRVTLWSTGEKLLGDIPTADPVDGLQGNDNSLVLPANVPPSAIWAVDYDDQPGDAIRSGHMGALALLPCQGGVRAQMPPMDLPPPVIVNCPVGTMLVGGSCLLPPRCPAGTRFRDGYCVVVGCPPNLIRVDGACVPPPRVCSRYETFVNGRCVPWACPRDLVRLPSGYCGCPRGEFYQRGKCVPPRECPPNMVQGRDGRCLPPACPEFWQRDRAGRCLPPKCERPFVEDRKGRCVCPPNLVQRKGRCVPPPVVQPCPKGMELNKNGRCVCPPNLVQRKGRCVPPPVVQPCPKGMELNKNGRCVCPPNLVQRKGRCVPPPVVQPCPKGMEMNQKGRCVCPQGMRLTKGVCRPPVVIDCKPGFVLKGGKCVGVLRPDLPIRPLPLKCDAGERLVNGQCVPVLRPCKPGTVAKGGRCVPIRIEKVPNDPAPEPEPPVLRKPNIQLMVPQNQMKLLREVNPEPQ